MGIIFNFEKLDVWQRSKDLYCFIFKLTNNYPTEEKYNLISQMRRCALFVSSNIAEGSARQTSKDKNHFYTMAYSSLMELVNQAIISFEFKFVNEKELTKVKDESLIIAKMLSNLKKSNQDNL
ncbi:four helix bundle protein [Flavobacteriaceae bacterium Ap0902]|nr:four helix bundle protein [Flavobacteriaceae bacterium Ap0902]